MMIAEKTVVDRIEQRAYALWEAEGRPDGRAYEFWERARQEIESSLRPDETPISPASTL